MRRSASERWDDIKVIAVLVAVGLLAIGVGVAAFFWTHNLLIALAAPFVLIAVLGGGMRQ